MITLKLINHGTLSVNRDKIAAYKVENGTVIIFVDGIQFSLLDTESEFLKLYEPNEYAITPSTSIS